MALRVFGFARQYQYQITGFCMGCRCPFPQFVFRIEFINRGFDATRFDADIYQALGADLRAFYKFGELIQLRLRV